MDGFEIPIGGDIAPFMQAMQELKAEIRNLAKAITDAFSPAKQATSAMVKITRALGNEAERDGSKFVQLAKGAISAVTAISGAASALAAVATAAPQIAALARRIGPLFQTGFRAARAAASAMGTQLRALMANPAFRRIAIGAVAAAVAIAGTVVAVRLSLAAFRRLAAGARSTFNAITSAARSTLSAIKSAFSGLGRLMPGGGGGGGSMLGPIAALVGAGGAIALVTSQLKSAFVAAKSFETLQVRVESFTGSIEATKDLLADLAKFGAATPFENIDLQEAAGKLLGAGIQNDVAKLTKDLAAVSKNGQQLLELSDALGKGFSKGKFQTEALDKFLERGVNLMPVLSKVTGLAGTELEKAIEKGLKFEDVAKAIAMMSAKGGQFHGVLARLSQTFEGVWSTFAGEFAEMQRAFAQPILESLKPLIQQATAMLGPMKEKAEAAGKAIGEMFLTSFALIKSGRVFDLIKTGLSIAFLTGAALFRRKLKGIIAFLATALPPVFGAAFAKLKDPGFWIGLRDVFRGLAMLIAAEILEATQLPGAENKRASAATALDVGSLALMNAGKVDLGQVIKQALQDGETAFVEAAKGGPASKALTAARAEWDGLSKEVEATVKDLRSKAAVPAPLDGAVGTGTGTRSDMSGGGGNTPLAVKSLTRIGGGGAGSFVAPMVTQQVRTNALMERQLANLQKIIENTKVRTLPPTAVYG